MLGKSSNFALALLSTLSLALGESPSTFGRDDGIALIKGTREGADVNPISPSARTRTVSRKRSTATAAAIGDVAYYRAIFNFGAISCSGWDPMIEFGCEAGGTLTVNEVRSDTFQTPICQDVDASTQSCEERLKLTDRTDGIVATFWADFVCSGTTNAQLVAKAKTYVSDLDCEGSTVGASSATELLVVNLTESFYDVDYSCSAGDLIIDADGDNYCFSFVGGSCGPDAASTCTLTLPETEAKQKSPISLEFVGTTPGNVDCSTATDLQAIQIGSTVGTSTDGVPGCDFSSSDRPSAWYKIMGTGDIFNVTVVDKPRTMETRIYEGSCFSLDCIDAQYPEGRFRQVSYFPTEIGVEYFVRVYNDISSNLPVDSFELLFDSFPLPVNDMCSGALPLTVSTTGNTIGATSANPLRNSPCSFRSDPGVWYTFDGTGEIFEIENIGTENNFYASLFSGDSCDQLTCLENDVWLRTFSSRRLTVDTVSGTKYYLLVLDVSRRSDFSFAVGYTTSTPAPTVAPPVNDRCEDAKTLVDSDMEDTSGAVQSSEDACFIGSSSSSAAGVWYQVEGTGGLITVDTCNSNTDFSTAISVHTGSSCSSLSCVGGSTTGCDGFFRGSEYAFDSELGETYWIYINGEFSFSDNSGGFQVNIDASDPGVIGSGIANVAGCEETCDLEMVEGTLLRFEMLSFCYEFCTPPEWSVTLQLNGFGCGACP